MRNVLRATLAAVLLAPSPDTFMAQPKKPPFSPTRPCPVCRGTGYDAKGETCKPCDGTGVIQGKAA
jgi:DnaJ-class molecular chaperone